MGDEKDRRYVDDPSDAPDDVNVEEGNQGGYYYEVGGSEDSGGEGDNGSSDGGQEEVTADDVSNVVIDSLAENIGYTAEQYGQDPQVAAENFYQQVHREGRDIAEAYVSNTEGTSVEEIREVMAEEFDIPYDTSGDEDEGNDTSDESGPDEVTMDGNDADAIADLLGTAALEATGGERSDIRSVRSEISGQRSSDEIDLDEEATENLRTALEYARESVGDEDGRGDEVTEGQIEILEDYLENEGSDESSGNNGDEDEGNENGGNGEDNDGGSLSDHNREPVNTAIDESHIPEPEDYPDWMVDEAENPEDFAERMAEDYQERIYSLANDPRFGDGDITEEDVGEYLEDEGILDEVRENAQNAFSN